MNSQGVQWWDELKQAAFALAAAQQIPEGYGWPLVSVLEAKRHPYEEMHFENRDYSRPGSSVVTFTQFQEIHQCRAVYVVSDGQIIGFSFQTEEQYPHRYRENDGQSQVKRVEHEQDAYLLKMSNSYLAPKQRGNTSKFNNGKTIRKEFQLSEHGTRHPQIYVDRIRSMTAAEAEPLPRNIQPSMATDHPNYKAPRDVRLNRARRAFGRRVHNFFAWTAASILSLIIGVAAAATVGVSGAVGNELVLGTPFGTLAAESFGGSLAELGFALLVVLGSPVAGLAAAGHAHDRIYRNWRR